MSGSFVSIRPATPGDAGAIGAVFDAAVRVGWTYLGALAEKPMFGPEEWDREVAAHAAPNVLLVATEEDGDVVGFVAAHPADGELYLLFVHPDAAGRGVGRRLLEACWRYGERADGHLILSTEHPAAMRRYARLGLPLRPCVSAAGIVASAAMPALDGVEDAGEAGIPVADAIGRAVRGAGHGRDLPVPLAHGARLLVFEDRAFAVARAGEVMLLAARDEAAAARVLWAALTAGPPGGTVRVDFITAGQDWAVRACLDAGLALSPDGPMFAGGRLGPLRPYIPSGAYL